MSAFNFVKSVAIVGTIGAISASSLVSVDAAQAASVINGDFSAGLAGWEIFGNATSPSQNALISTEINQIKNDDALESFLGLTPNALGMTAFNGSAIKQTIFLNAGDTLTFRWNFLTNELDPSPGALPPENDFSFYVVNILNNLADVESSTFSTGTLGFLNQTGDSTASFVAPTTGSYLLGFGVVNDFDQFRQSGLSVDNVNVTPIPTPALLPAMVGLGIGVIRKRKQAA
jgi:hypothetical protein